MIQADKTKPKTMTFRVLLLVFLGCNVVLLIVCIIRQTGSMENMVTSSEEFLSLCETPPHDTKPEAQVIVESSFPKTFGVVQSCTSETNLTLTECLKYHSQSDNPEFPWWFRTMLRDSINKFGNVNGYWHNLASPSHGFGMCTLEKVATSQWRKVFCALDNTTNHRGGACWHSAYQLPGLDRYKMIPPPSTRHRNERFVVLRDPLERFLSAFLNKCTGRLFNIEDHCGGIFKSNKSLTQGVWDKNPKRMFELYVETMPLQWDLHFMPMALFCNGLYQHLNEYDVYNMGPNFYQDLKQLGEIYNITALLERVFKVPSLKTVTKVNVGVETSAPTQVHKYYSPKSLRRVLEFVSIDYTTLDLTIPQWAHDMLLNEDRNETE